jgi:ribonuclease BN (tRNA processing enzyme)
VELTVVGCSGSFPGPDGPASCYLIEADGFRMVLDLGNGALGALQRYVPLRDVDAVCLSHLHADHCLDMCAYQVVRTYDPAGVWPPIPVYAPVGAALRLDRASAANPALSGSADSGSAEPPMARSFDFRLLSEGTLEIGPLRVTVARMNHPVETYGFRLEHGGRVIGYSADTGPTKALENLAVGADVLLCEASFLAAPGLPDNLHMTAAQAAEHAARAGAGRLVLTHLVPWNDPERTRSEATGFVGPVALAHPGMRI